MDDGKGDDIAWAFIMVLEAAVAMLVIIGIAYLVFHLF